VEASLAPHSFVEAGRPRGRRLKVLDSPVGPRALRMPGVTQFGRHRLPVVRIPPRGGRRAIMMRLRTVLVVSAAAAAMWGRRRSLGVSRARFGVLHLQAGPTSVGVVELA
jgi:hypothetical protein